MPTLAVVSLSAIDLAKVPLPGHFSARLWDLIPQNAAMLSTGPYTPMTEGVSAFQAVGPVYTTIDRNLALLLSECFSVGVFRAIYRKDGEALEAFTDRVIREVYGDGHAPWVTTKRGEPSPVRLVEVLRQLAYPANPFSNAELGDVLAGYPGGQGRAVHLAFGRSYYNHLSPAGPTVAIVFDPGVYDPDHGPIGGFPALYTPLEGAKPEA